MGKSLNGWPVPPAKLRTFQIQGTDRRVTLDVDAGRVLAALAADYHRWVRPIDKGAWDEGGYNNRQARNANAWSNHASGTAVDLNWSEEGRLNSSWGRNFFATAKAKAGIALLKRRYGKVVWWGGDWSRLKDYMHWEIRTNVDRAQVLRFCTEMKIDKDGFRK